MLLVGAIGLACAAEGPGDGSVLAGSSAVAGAPMMSSQPAAGGATSQVLPSAPGAGEGGAPPVAGGNAGGAGEADAPGGLGAGGAEAGGGSGGTETQAPSGVPTNPDETGTSDSTTAGTGEPDATETPTEVPSFSDIAFRMNLSCATVICHTGPPYFDPVLSDAKGTLYDTLMTWVVEGCNDTKLIVPGDPDNSAFFMVLEPGRCPGVPLMPLECPECVTEDDLDAIRAWVAAGAMP